MITAFYVFANPEAKQLEATIRAPSGLNIQLRINRTETSNHAGTMINEFFTMTEASFEPGLYQFIKYDWVDFPVHYFDVRPVINGQMQSNFVYIIRNPPFPASSVGYIPLRGNGAHTVKSFPKMNIILLEQGNYKVADLDFINVQALSMAQAARKARQVASLVPQGRLILQSGGIEQAARPAGRFEQAMLEIARVIEFCTEEVRNQQKFDVDNVELIRYL